MGVLGERCRAFCKLVHKRGKVVPVSQMAGRASPPCAWASKVVEISAPRINTVPWLAEMPQAVPVGADVGSPAKGFELFYDTARVDGCRVCHRLNGNGGPVGIDLADLGTSVLEIYGAIAAPKMVSDNFPSVEIVTEDGTRHVGVKKSETGTVIRYFDIASTLPVLRTLPLEHVDRIKDLAGGLHDHTALRYRKQDLLDLTAIIYASRR